MAPNDLGVQLILADAYVAASHKDRARALMEKMAKQHPQDANVAARLKSYAN